MQSRAPSPFRYGLVFALLAVLLYIQPLCKLTYVLLFGPAEGRIQSEPPEGVPLPVGLSWSPNTLGFINAMARFQPAAALGLGIALFCVVAYFVLRALNPTFRLTTGVDWDKSLLVRTYMHTAPLIKAFLIGVTAFLPLFGLWLAIGVVLRGSLALAVQLAVCGAAGWFLFSRDGVATDYESGNYELPRERSRITSLLVRGALAGLVLWTLFRFAPALSDQQVFGFYSTLGGVGEGAWHGIAGTILALWAGQGFGAGGIITALALPDRTPVWRLRGAVLPAVVLLVTLYVGRVALPGHYRDRYDYDPTSRMPPPVQLSAKTGVPMSASGRHAVLVTGATRAFVLDVMQQSFVGLDAGPEAARRIQEFLKSRDSRTSLSTPAYFTLHDAASLQWDVLESLRIDYERLTRCSDVTYLQPLLDTLRSCASTPETRRYADLLADETRFTFPDRQSKEFMGDLFARLGDRQKAETWYQKAQLPGSQVAARLSEQTMFREGEITGRVLMNGKPVAGARVGIIPIYAVETLPQNFLENRTLRPYWLRWVSTKSMTGADGRFTLKNVVAASYRIVLQMPEDRPVSYYRSLTIGGGPDMIFVGYGRPKMDVGDLKLVEPAAAAKKPG